MSGCFKSPMTGIHSQFSLFNLFQCFTIFIVRVVFPNIEPKSSLQKIKLIFSCSFLSSLENNWSLTLYNNLLHTGGLLSFYPNLASSTFLHESGFLNFLTFLLFSLGFPPVCLYLSYSMEPKNGHRWRSVHPAPPQPQVEENNHDSHVWRDTPVNTSRNETCLSSTASLCWVVFSKWFDITLGAFPAVLLQHQLFLLFLDLCLWLLLPMCNTLHLSLLNFFLSISDHLFLICQDNSEFESHSLKCLKFSYLGIICMCWLSISWFKSLIKILIGPLLRTARCGIPPKLLFLFDRKRDNYSLKVIFQLVVHSSLRNFI